MTELFLGLVFLAVLLYGVGGMLTATGHRSAERLAWWIFWLGTFCLGAATITALANGVQLGLSVRIVERA